MGSKESSENITLTAWPVGKVDIKISRILLQLRWNIIRGWTCVGVMDSNGSALDGPQSYFWPQKYLKASKIIGFG